MKNISRSVFYFEEEVRVVETRMDQSLIEYKIRFPDKETAWVPHWALFSHKSTRKSKYRLKRYSLNVQRVGVSIAQGEVKISPDMLTVLDFSAGGIGLLIRDKRLFFPKKATMDIVLEFGNKKYNILSKVHNSTDTGTGNRYGFTFFRIMQDLVYSLEQENLLISA